MRKYTGTIWHIDEKKPDMGDMILADTGTEWVILMYEDLDYGIAWEDTQMEKIIQWTYLPPSQAEPDAVLADAAEKGLVS